MDSISFLFFLLAFTAAIFSFLKSLQQTGRSRKKREDAGDESSSLLKKYLSEIEYDEDLEEEEKSLPPLPKRQDIPRQYDKEKYAFHSSLEAYALTSAIEEEDLTAPTLQSFGGEGVVLKRKDPPFLKTLFQKKPCNKAAMISHEIFSPPLSLRKPR